MKSGIYSTGSESRDSLSHSPQTHPISPYTPLPIINTQQQLIFSWYSFATSTWCSNIYFHFRCTKSRANGRRLDHCRYVYICIALYTHIWSEYIVGPKDPSAQQSYRSTICISISQYFRPVAFAPFDRLALSSSAWRCSLSTTFILSMYQCIYKLNTYLLTQILNTIIYNYIVWFSKFIRPPSNYLNYTRVHFHYHGWNALRLLPISGISSHKQDLNIVSMYV